MVNNASVKTAKRHSTAQSLNSAIKSICDIMRRSNCAGPLAASCEPAFDVL